jgi:hypothetical protein
MWPGMCPPPQQLAHPPQHALLAASVYYGAPSGPAFASLPMPPPHQQQVTSPTWTPWTGAWEQQSLVNFFNTMALTPLVVTDWVTESGASNHTTSDAGNLTFVHPPTSPDPSSIVVANGSALLVTSVGDSALSDPFYLNNVLVTPDIIQNLLSVCCFTSNNWCNSSGSLFGLYPSKFDLFGISMKDLLRGT